MSDGICEECGTDAETTLELIDELIAAKSDLTAKLAEAERERDAARAAQATSDRRISVMIECARAQRDHVDELRAEVARLKGIYPDRPAIYSAGDLPRYGIRWNGPTQPIATPMYDGYWTPHHLAEQARESAEARLTALREAVEWVYSVAGNVSPDWLGREIRDKIHAALANSGEL
jgi:hypothetical protein